MNRGGISNSKYELCKSKGLPIREAFEVVAVRLSYRERMDLMEAGRRCSMSLARSEAIPPR